jgi:hypothetical protein
MPIEFRPDGEPILIDHTYRLVECSKRFGRRLYSNGHHAVEIAVGRKREKWLAEYNRQHFKPERTEVRGIVATLQQSNIPESTTSTTANVAAVERVESTDIAQPPVQVDERPRAQIVQTDSEAEQEFLNSVPADDRTLYKPLEHEWFLAHVVHRDWQNGKYILLELSTGDIVYCPWQRVTRSPGNHSICLPLETECSVRIVLDHGKYFALEMHTEGQEPFSVARAQISKWHGMAGSAYRECLCPIFVLCTRENWEIASTIQVGDWVEIVHRPSEKRGWVGFIQRKISAPLSGNGDK